MRLRLGSTLEISFQCYPLLFTSTPLHLLDTARKLHALCVELQTSSLLSITLRVRGQQTFARPRKTCHNTRPICAMLGDMHQGTTQP